MKTLDGATAGMLARQIVDLAKQEQWTTEQFTMACIVCVIDAAAQMGWSEDDVKRCILPPLRLAKESVAHAGIPQRSASAPFELIKDQLPKGSN